MGCHECGSRSRALSRRELLRTVGGGLGTLGLASVLDQPASASGLPSQPPIPNTQPLPMPHFAPRAKRVIHLFMNGGPFQGDLFDPKPAINQYAGQRPAEVQFRTENV